MSSTLSPTVTPMIALALQQLRQPPAEQVVAFELDVGERHDLREERVDAGEPGEHVAELVLLLLREGVEPVDGRLHHRVDPLVVLLRVGEQQADHRLDLLAAQHVERAELGVGVVEEVRVGRRGDGAHVPGSERLLDRLGRVAEVEHERAGLVGVRAVQAGQRLDGGETGEGLVDVHRVELRLVEAGLVLLGDDEDLPVVGVEPGRRLRLGEPVDPRLGPLLPLVVELAGEGAQHADVADAVLGAVLVERPLVPQGVEPGGGDHHRLRLAADLGGDVVAEVVDDHVGALGEVVLVQRDEPGDGGAGAGLVELGVVGDRLVDLEVGVVGDVVGEHVVDEALLDRLAHRVQVERLVLARLAPPPEQLERAALRGGGEREERHVRLPPAGVDLLGEEVLHRVGHLVDQRHLRRLGRRELRRLGGGRRRRAAAEHLLHLLGGVAGLRGVGLVDDHRVAA